MEVEQISEEQRKQSEIVKNEGNELFKKKEYIQAIQKYSEAIELNPSDSTYYSNRANAYQQLRQFQKSLEDCNSALKLDPEFLKVMRRRAIILQQLGQFQDAQLQFENAQKKSPKDKTIYQELKQHLQIIEQWKSANNYYDQKKYSDAIMEINQLLKEVPYYQKIQMLQVEITALMGNVARAQQLLVQYKNTWDDPQSPDVIYFYGVISLYQGKSEQAKKYFLAGMQRDPDHKKCMLALKKTKKCESLKDEGNQLFKAKEFDQALAKYDEVIEIDPLNKQLNSIIYANKASVYMNMEQYEKAKQQLEISLELNSEYGKAYFRRAEANMKLEEFEQAIHDYKKYQELDPSQNMKENIRQAQVELKKSKMKDYYKILGVAKTAEAKEIKKAYHKMALKYHPDRVQESDKKDAEKKFKEIGEAYAVLSDPEKKKLVDQGVDPNDQSQGMGGGGGFGFDPFDMFRSNFGGGGGHGHGHGGYTFHFG